MKKETIKEEIEKLIDTFYYQLDFNKLRNRLQSSISKIRQETIKETLEKVIDEIDKNYKKEKGITNWLDLREELKNLWKKK